MLVTDATTPAGAEAARRLAAAGAWVACGLRAEHEAGKGLVDAIRMGGGRALLLAGDPAEPREAWTMLQRLDAEWGPPDVVIVVPPPGEPPERTRAAFANLLHGGAPGHPPTRPGTRFLLAVPAGDDDALATLAAGVPEGVCVCGVVGTSSAPRTGATLAGLATAELCPHGVMHSA